jgi:hypothetical protein
MQRDAARAWQARQAAIRSAGLAVGKGKIPAPPDMATFIRLKRKGMTSVQAMAEARRAAGALL